MTDEHSDSPPAPPAVSSKVRSHLRSLAHGLSPVVHIGGDGVTEAVAEAVATALHDHELIKVKLGKAFPGERRDAARQLADAVGADLTQVIGRVVVLYRPRPAKADDKRPRIELPKGLE